MSRGKKKKKNLEEIIEIGTKFKDIKNLLLSNNKLKRKDVKFLASFLQKYEDEDNNEYIIFLKECNYSSNLILKKKADKILSYYNKNLKNFGKKIWKSQVGDTLRGASRFLLLLIIFITILVPILNAFITLQDIDDYLYFIYQFSLMPFLILPLTLIFYKLTHISYLIIYQKGIKIRRPLLPIFSKFISGKDIKQIEQYHPKHRIKFILKNEKTYSISYKWVDIFHFIKGEYEIKEYFKIEK